MAKTLSANIEEITLGVGKNDKKAFALVLDGLMPRTIFMELFSNKGVYTFGKQEDPDGYVSQVRFLVPSRKEGLKKAKDLEASLKEKGYSLLY